MAARLYQRGRVWWAWGYYADGERWAESCRTRDRAAAVRIAERLERERAAVDRAETAALGVERALRDVITAREREGRTAGTIATYRVKAGHACRIFGADCDVHTLTLASLEAYIDTRASEGAMRSTIDIELRVLRSALIYAARHGRYRGAVRAIWPTAALSKAHIPHDRYLTRDEYARLAAALPKDRADYLAGYVYTGARRSELWRIEARDVDIARNTIRIRGTKTASADRVVPIAAELLPLVRRLLRECDGGPLWPEYEEWDVMRRACERIGIESVSATDLRRTFASWLAQAGVPLLVTARLMGHRSTRMVERVYAHFGADDLQAAIRALGATATKRRKR